MCVLSVIGSGLFDEAHPAGQREAFSRLDVCYNTCQVPRDLSLRHAFPQKGGEDDEADLCFCTYRPQLMEGETRRASSQHVSSIEFVTGS